MVADAVAAERATGERAIAQVMLACGLVINRTLALLPRRRASARCACFGE
jgi:hypothetical protein